MENTHIKPIISRKEVIFASIICASMAGLDLLALPAAWFLKLSVSDITPQILTIMINQWILIAIGLVAIRFLCPELFRQIGFVNLKSGLRAFCLPILFFAMIPSLAFSLGLIGFYNYSPTVEKILVEGIVYYIGVGIIEELYLRALLLNLIERLAYKSKHSTLIAILVSSAVFGLGHIFGMLGQSALTIVCRIFWTISMGIILGVIYKKSQNLWLAAAAHILADFCGVAFCFVSSVIFPVPTVIAVAICYLVLALYFLWKYFLRKSQTYKEECSE